MRNIFCTAMLVGASAFPAAVWAAAADHAELQALRAQVQALEQQLKTLARQIDLREQAAVAATQPVPKITVSDDSYALASPDHANSIRLRALLQVDSRLFFREGGGISNNTFTLRRARLITEGSLAKTTSYQFVTEFGGSSVSILDANFTFAVSESLQFKFGKYKTPVGLEVLQSDTATSFTERSMVAGLLPNRDLGIQLGGALAAGRVGYAVGIFNGVADGANSTNIDFDEEKDVVARVFATPFITDTGSLLHGLSFGVGASGGRQKTSAARAVGYRTDGQQTFFAYDSSVIADGRIWRVSPQLDYRLGGLGVIGEYVVSTVNLRPNTAGAKTELQNKGWHLAVGYVFTGENSTYGQVAPRADFNVGAGTWGAFEVFARCADVEIDDLAFPTFASPATNASEARAYGLGLNWYLTKAVVFKFDYYQTEFGFPALSPVVSAAPVLRQDERAFVTRFQLAF